MNGDVVIEELHVDDDFWDSLISEDHVGVAKHKLTAGSTVTAVHELGHGDSYEVMDEEYRIIAEEVTEMEDVFVDSGNSADGWLLFGSSSGSTQEPSVVTCAFVIFLLAVCAIVLYRCCSCMNIRKTIPDSKNKLTQLDGNLREAEDLIKGGRIWSVHQVLSEVLKTIVTSFKQQSVDLTKKKEFLEWLHRAEKFNDLFKNLLSEIRDYIECSKRRGDVEDEHFLVLLGAELRSIFDSFLDQKRFLHAACPDAQDRLYSALKKASESDNVKEILEVRELCHLEASTDKYAEFMDSLQRRLEHLRDQRKVVIEKEVKSALDVDLNTLYRNLSLAFQSSPLIQEGSDTEESALRPALIGEDAAGVLTRPGAESSDLNENVRLQCVIEKSRIERDSNRELRKHLNDFELQCSNEENHAKLMARNIYEAWKREEQQSALCDALNRVHDSLSDTFSAGAILRVKTAFCEKLNNRKWKDACILISALLVSCGIRLRKHSNAAGVSSASGWTMWQLRTLCQHIVGAYDASCGASDSGVLPSPDRFSHNLVPYSGIQESWMLHSIPSFVSMALFESISTLLPSSFGVLGAVTMLLREFSGCVLLICYMCADPVLLYLALKVSYFVITLGGRINVPAPAIAQQYFSYVVSVTYALAWIKAFYSMRHVISALYEGSKIICIWCMIDAVILCALCWADSHLSWRWRPASDLFSSKGPQWNYIDIRVIFLASCTVVCLWTLLLV